MATLAILGFGGVAVGGLAYLQSVLDRPLPFAGTSPSGTPASTTPSSPEATTPSTPMIESSPRPERKGTLVIHGTGDVNVDPSYIPAFQQQGYEWAWSGLNGLFKKDDLTVINLECPITDVGAIDPKEFNFRCDPEALPSMRKAGIEVANQGNNHAQDFSTEGMLDSRKNLLKAGIAPVGTGKNAAQAEEPALFEENGWTIAVVGFGGVVPSSTWIATKDHPGMANGDSIPLMVRTVKKAAKKADLVIVTIHWGTELHTLPDADDIVRAHAMVDAGADIIFGGHSHRLQPMDVYKGAPIFWSLGNFVWPAHSYDGSVTAVAEVVVKPNGKMKGSLLPAFIVSDGHPELKKQA